MAPPASLARYGTTPTDSEFEQLKPLMEELYMKQKMVRKEVSRIMEEQYNFRATKYQYEKAFQRWNWTKYSSSHLLDAVCLSIVQHEGRGIPEVFHNGDKIEDDRIRREISRRSTAFFQNRNAPVVLPDELVILTRTDRSSTLFVRLPFHAFNDWATTAGRSCLGVAVSGSDQPTFSYLDISPSTLTGEANGLNTGTLDMRRLPSTYSNVLDSVVFPVLSSVQLSKALITGPSLQMDMTAHHWQTLLSVSNNFAGLANLDTTKFFKFLRNEMGQALQSIICSASTSHTARALVFNITRVSIGMGDAETVHFILSHNSNLFNANTLVCNINGTKCSALEKALALSHADVVKELLHHKASVWNVGFEQEPCQPRFALDFVIMKCRNHPFRMPQINTALSLIEVSQEVTCTTVTYLIEKGQLALVRLLLEANRIIKTKALFDGNIFQSAACHLDEDCCLKLLGYFDGSDADVCHAMNPHGSGPERALSNSLRSALSYAADSGYVRFFEALLHRGVEPDQSILSRAVERGNEKIVMMILKQCATVKRSRHSNCRSNGVSGNGHEVPLFSHRRVRHQGKIRSNITNFEVADDQKGIDLVIAIKYGRNDVAEELIDSGVELNAYSDEYGGPPLHEALLQRDASLVSLLLDAGANPRCYRRYENVNEGGSPRNWVVHAIDLAVCWGDQVVVQKLINAGALTNSIQNSAGFQELALIIAARKADQALVRRLLHSSLRPDLLQWRSAIQAAGENHDVQMVRLLLTSDSDLGPNAQIHLTVSVLSSEVYKSTDHSSYYNLERRELINAEIFDEVESNSKWCPSKTAPTETSQNPTPEVVCEELGLAGQQEISDPAGNDLVQQIFNAIQWADDHGHFNGHLSLAKCTHEICDLILDASKLRYPPFYQSLITRNIDGLIRARDYGNFLHLVGKRFGDIATTAASGPFKHMYYDAVAVAKHGRPQFVEKLLELGCDPNGLIQEFDDDTSANAPRVIPHLTAFLGAIATGSISIVKLFIEHKADVNLSPSLAVKRTPLQQAAAYGYLEIADLLIKFGATVNAPAARFGGATALQFAAIGGYNAIINLLISYGADVNAPAAKVNGRSALEGAAENGRLDTVKVLLNAGAAQNGEDQAQIRSTIRYADDKGHPYISDLLREYLVNDDASVNEFQGSTEPYDDLSDWSRWDDNAVSME